MKYNRLAGLSVIALSTTLWPGWVHGQDTETSAQTTLKRIIVSVNKRVEDAHKVAATVDRADSEELSARGVDSIDQIDKVFPDTAIDMRSSRVYSNFTVRGQSSPDFYNPSVQVYVDGLPQDFTTFGQVLPAGVENVELLYGPQATLYGRGAIGGVINVTTRKPDNDLRVDLGSTFGTAGLGAIALLNTPLIEDTLYSDVAVNFRYETSDYTRMGTGESLGKSTDWSGRARLRFAPSDSPLDVMVTAQTGTLESEEEQFVMTSKLEDRIAVPVQSKYRLDLASYGLHASYDLDGATITALTGYQDRELDRTIFGFHSPETQSTFSQEIRIASNAHTENAIDYVGGLYFQTLNFERRFPAFASGSEQTINSYAAFADLTWHTNDRLDITAGARGDYETVEAKAEFGSLQRNASGSYSALSPKIGMSFAVSDQWQAYGLFSTGFKAGGYTRTLNVSNIVFDYDPQTTYNGEAGIKYRSLDGNIEASLSAYYNITKDYQMFVGIQPLQYLANVGEVTSKGLNFKVRADMESGVGIIGGLGLNNSEFTEYNNPATPGLNLTGNRVPYAPKATANLFLDYTYDLPNQFGQLIPRLGVKLQSTIWFEETNTLGQNTYALVDGGVSWNLGDTIFADLFVNNIFDKTYTVYGFDATSSGFGNVFQLGRGRHVGGRLKVKL